MAGATVLYLVQGKLNTIEREQPFSIQRTHAPVSQHFVHTPGKINGGSALSAGGTWHLRAWEETEKRFCTKPHVLSSVRGMCVTSRGFMLD